MNKTSGYRLERPWTKSVLLLFSLAATAAAQESARPSLTGATAAELREPTARLMNYNLKAGPFTFDLHGSLGVEFNDNVFLAESQRTADVIFRPQITLNAYCQVSEKNALSIDLGIGYAKYVHEGQLDTNSILIAPNSRFSYDIYIADFRINLHDSIAISQDPVQEGALSNQGDFARLENTAGVSVLWDLNAVKLILGYDLYTFRAMTGSFDFLNRLEHQVTASVAYDLGDAVTAGVDAGFTAVDYQQNFENNSLNYQAGPFLEVQLSHYLAIRATAGYQAMNFETGGGNGDQSDVGSPFGSLILVNRVNNVFHQDLNTGYESRLGLTTNYIKSVYVRYEASWRVNRLVSANLTAFFETLQESQGFLPENAHRFGAAVALTYQLSPKSRVEVDYQFTTKDSNVRDQSYYQNRVSTLINYDF